MLLPSKRRRITHITLIEFYIFLRQIGGIHQRGRVPEIQANVQIELFRRYAAHRSLNRAFVGWPRLSSKELCD